MRELEDQLNSMQHAGTASQQDNGSDTGALSFQGSVKRTLLVLTEIMGRRKTQQYDHDSSIATSNYQLGFFGNIGNSHSSAALNVGVNDAFKIEPSVPIDEVTSSSSDNTSCEVTDASSVLAGASSELTDASSVLTGDFSELTNASSKLLDESNESSNNARRGPSPFIPIHKFTFINNAFLAEEEEEELCKLENPLFRGYDFFPLSPSIVATNGFDASFVPVMEAKP